MPDIDPRFALTAVAQVEQSNEAFGKADILWKALSDAASAAGEQRAADLYALNRCCPLAKLKRKPEAFAVASASLERALQRRDPAPALDGVFASYVTNPEKGKGAEIFLPSIARLPDSYEKVQVILQALIELEPSQVVGLHQQALEIARRLNESLLEAYCLVGMAYREQDTEKAQAQWDQAQTLMAG